MDSKIVFQTKRLTIRLFTKNDADYFFDMMGNPNVMQAIPQKVFSKKESNLNLQEILSGYKKNSKRKIWAIQLKNNTELIGLCGLIFNNENNNEIAYRFREKYWGLGYGTEIAKGLIDFGFQKLHFDLITADAFIENKKSIKIIEKFMLFDKEFFNDNDNCIDRRYQLKKEDWLKSMN